MCNCADEINEDLKPRNARLAFGFSLNRGTGALNVAPALIETEKIAPRGKKPPTVMATFCPFCGVKYEHATVPTLTQT